MKRTLLLILIILKLFISAQGQIQTAGSYLNISRPNGGAITTGDTLEIRAVISVPSGTTITAVSYRDAVPVGTLYIPNSLKAITNEGVIVGAIANTGSYTDLPADDRGQNLAGNIVINLGDGATSAVGGTINGTTTKPRFYGSACILLAAYRVKITSLVGTSITIAGSFRYTTGSVQNVPLANNILSIQPSFSCSSSGVVNFLLAETNGGFSSGTTQNRSASPNVTGFTFMNIAAASPQDGQYSVVKNTSPTQYTGGAPAASDKVFTAWDIFGDHTGTNNAVGNAPSANGANAGYMLVVNASYAPAVVFNTTILGLTINTNYTMSFWLRNLCPTCGSDPNSNGASGTPGVKPNLAFEIAGQDYYTTGEITYSGQWLKKTFTFSSGASTSIVINIKNNAPGGGGNDWAIDDISLVQCLSLLPIKLTSFHANLVADDVLLKWETAWEDHSAHFDIERSSDGVQFNKLGSVIAGGSTGSNRSYSYVDAHVPNGRQFYRLKMVDIDGSYKFSDIISINSTGKQNGLVIFPNPVKENAKVQFRAAQSGLAHVKIHNLQGQLVAVQDQFVSAGINEFVLQGISLLKNGVYTVQLVMGATNENTRLIVQK